ncbi:hypothetical protein ABEY65_27800 [Priestia aryabhattai]|uniref:hypothetical protein n=1 Tax=Priestia aryabhattai TaxID=412384 RepID=UPI003D27C400
MSKARIATACLTSKVIKQAEMDRYDEAINKKEKRSEAELISKLEEFKKECNDPDSSIKDLLKLYKQAKIEMLRKNFFSEKEKKIRDKKLLNTIIKK